MTDQYDAILIVSFGGPEKPDDVIPFLENVLRGKSVPRERLLEVADHYQHFGGVSPINAQVREFIAELKPELHRIGIDLPIYWGNRNWHPLLLDTVRQMQNDGIRKALAFVMSAYSSYSGCRQYRENIEQARTLAGAAAPSIDKLRVFYNHPAFIAANADRLRDAVESFALEERADLHVAFTAHSIPQSMADHCDYVLQLSETCRLVAEELHIPREQWTLVYQSRSGRPEDPWLGPDILEHLRRVRREAPVAIAPIGFLSDHIEILFDLDEQARQVANELGLRMVRSATVGNHPLFIGMVRELIQERLEPGRTRRAIGAFGPRSDECASDCCPYQARRPNPSEKK